MLVVMIFTGSRARNATTRRIRNLAFGSVEATFMRDVELRMGLNPLHPTLTNGASLFFIRATYIHIFPRAFTTARTRGPPRDAVFCWMLGVVKYPAAG